MTSWAPLLDRTERPLFVAIARMLERDVEAGRVRPGERLPTHRELARSLGVTIGTVTRAYAEARRRGLVVGTVGRGTFVRESSRARFGLEKGAGEGPIDLRVNLPAPCELDAIVQASLRELASDPSIALLLDLAPHAGELRHRRAGASWMRARGFPAEAEQVLVTSGAQHAILVVLATLARPGECVLAESLAFPGLRAAAEMLGLELTGIEMDAQGARPDALRKIARRRRARLFVSVATLHNPTTRTQSPERRAELARVARSLDLRILEDDPYGALLDAPLPPLAAEDPDRHLYVTSTTKALAGGLRLAFLHAPADLVPELTTAIRASTFCASPLTAELAARWLEDGTAVRLIAARRAEASERVALARSLLPGRTLATHPAAPHAWLELPRSIDPARLVAAAHHAGLELTPASIFHVGPGSAPRALRLALGSERDRARLTRGLEILERFLRGERTPRWSGVL